MSVPLGLYDYDGTAERAHPFMGQTPAFAFVQQASDISLGMIAVNSIRLRGAASTHLRLGIMGSVRDIHALRKMHGDWNMALTIRGERDTFSVLTKEGITLWLGEPGGRIAFRLCHFSLQQFAALTTDRFRGHIAYNLRYWHGCGSIETLRGITVGLASYAGLSEGQDIALAQRFKCFINTTLESFFLDQTFRY